MPKALAKDPDLNHKRCLKHLLKSLKAKGLYKHGKDLVKKSLNTHSNALGPYKHGNRALSVRKKSPVAPEKELQSTRKEP